ncbi:DUF2637 domain-containing protein [Kitasatospora sp. NPDC048286]|uniref:DUF2637 domain-containing protein n=1 Tax=Kitasatospora sp. NPDC048286 TaxID=3364047 RepID=UPI003715424A
MSKEQIRSAEVALAVGTWTITLGAVIYSMLTVTPLMSKHSPDGWKWTAPILPLVVDAAVVIVVRLDSTLARLGGDGGWWPVVLRWMTGAMTVLLNVGQSALDHDKVGVAVHSVAPLLLIVTAETSLAYRRAIAAALATHKAHERDEQTERERRTEQRQQEEREERQAQQERADQRERERREHDERMATQQREHELRMADDERQEQRRLDDAERTDRERREHEASERERREHEREQAAAQDAERQRQELLTAPATDVRLPEDQARLKIQACVKLAVPQRRAAELTGWSAGWVAARYQELRTTAPERPALHSVPAEADEATASDAA